MSTRQSRFTEAITAATAARQGDEFRLAEIIPALSLATDLADGCPLEKAMPTCLLAVELGREVAQNEETLSELYYVSHGESERLHCSSSSSSSATAVSPKLSGFFLR